MAQLRAVEQTAFDEQVIEDAEIEAALDDREKKKNSLDAVRKIYDGAHEYAMAKITELELPEGGQHRVGRFRITREAVPAGHREFDTKASFAHPDPPGRRGLSDDVSATFQMPFRVQADTAESAIAKAKAEANAAGWTVRTIASCRQQANGDWLVTLAVYAAEKSVPA